MKNKIEEKIAQFIKETEVSNIVAPELNVDRDRATWLKKQGKSAEGLSEADEKVTCPRCSGSKTVEGKPCPTCRGTGKLSRAAWEKNYGNPATAKKEGRMTGMQGAGVFEDASTGVFDVNTAKDDAKKLQQGINAPVIATQVSTLGGDKNVAIMIQLSLDPKEKWANGIFHNSRYSMFRFDNNGTLKQHSRDRAVGNFRQVRVKSVDDAIAKINAYIKQVGIKKESGPISTTVSRSAEL